MFALDFFNKWRIESGVREYPRRTFAMDYPNLDETDRLIGNLRPLVERTQNAEGLAYMADLFIHRCRLQTKQEMIESSETGVAMLDENANERIWERTGLDSLHEMVWALNEDGLLISAMEFRNAKFLRDNLKEAKKYLVANRRVSPMDSRNHLLLAQVDSLVGTSVSAASASEKAVFLAPNSPNCRLVAALSLLQARQVKKAAPHLREVIKLNPNLFPRVMRIVFNQSGRNLPTIDHESIANDVMPDNPKLLYNLSEQYLLPRDSPARKTALIRADNLLVELSAANSEGLLLKAKIKLALGQPADAIDYLNQTLTSKPGDHDARLVLAQTLLDMRDLEGAKRELEYILPLDSDSRRIKRCEKLLEQVKEEMRQPSR